ncbi:MAG: alpha/beta hydrolase [Pseudomonadota bacterium]
MGFAWPVGDAPSRVTLRQVGGPVFVECQAWGANPGSGAPTVLLLHEGLGSVALWRRFPAALAQATGWGVLAWSRAGHGFSNARRSPWSADYLQQEADSAVAPVLDAFGIDRAVLLGHSDGGSVAAAYAGGPGRADPRLVGLVLMAPHFFTEPEQLAAIRDTGQRYRAGGLRTRLVGYHRDVDTLFSGWHGAWTDPDFAVGDLQVRLPGIRLPMLALQGADDAYGSTRQLEVLAACAGRVDTHLLDACGHHPHLEHPDLTGALIARFLTECAS